MPALDATGRDRDIGDDVILRTPGLEGEAEVRRPTSPGDRGPAGVTREAMEQTFASTDLQAFRTVEIASARRVGGAGQAGRNRGGTDENYIELEAPDAGPDFGQVLLYQDEAGVMTWHTGEAVKRAAERGTGRRRYRVWGGVAESEGDGDGTRGLLSAIGSKVLTIVVFPLIDPLLGKVGDFFAQRWEAKHRPYGIRAFGPTGYGEPTADQWTEADWKRVAEGRALLFIHGTGSRSHSGFGAASPAVPEVGARKVRGTSLRRRPPDDRDVAPRERGVAHRSDPARLEARPGHHLPLTRRPVQPSPGGAAGCAEA